MSSLERFLERMPAKNRQGSQELTKAIWGGVAQEHDALKENIAIVSRYSASLDNIGGDMLDEIIVRTTGFDRLQGESDQNYQKMMHAFFRRNKNKSWATKWTLIDALSYFINKDTIHFFDNWIETNLFLDNDFEAFDGGEYAAPFGAWTPSVGSVFVEITDTFQEARCLRIPGASEVYQDVTVSEAGPYVLIVPFKGTLSVKVERLSDGMQWSPAAMAWVALAATSLSNTGARYDGHEQFIVMDAPDTLRFTFGPAGASSESRIDYLQFGPKPLYPYFMIIVSTFGQGSDFLNAWPSGADPVAGLDYNHSTYLDVNFIGGEGTGLPVSYYERIMDVLKPCGVRAEIDFIGRS